MTAGADAPAPTEETAGADAPAPTEGTAGADAPAPTPTPTPTPEEPSTSSRVTLDASKRYQTLLGWEATAQAAHDPADGSGWEKFGAPLLDRAVNELGLTRLRVEIRSGSEGSGSGYAITNDDADPNHINAAGFRFDELDLAVQRIVLPMKALVENNGEKLHINVCYVSFMDQLGAGTPSLHAERPAEYAEFVLATYQHMKSAFGLDIDSWEVILEPDNVQAWTPSRMGAAIVAAGKTLVSHGFTPRFVTPSTSNMSLAISYYDQILAVPGALDVLSELSYHRYSGVSDSALAELTKRSQRDGLGMAMLEHIGSDTYDLHKDLSIGMNTSWQQFTLAYFGTNDAGGKYYGIDQSDPANPKVVMMSRTKLLRQYFKFVRPGAVRFDASSNDGNFAPVAFKNPNGKVAVVVRANAQGSFAIDALPAGTYGVEYTTNSQYAVKLPDQTVASGQALVTQIPGTGAITIYGK